MSRLSTLQRPPLLVRAARHLAARIKDDTLLRRLGGSSASSNLSKTTLSLLGLEAELNDLRHRGESYSAARHVEVLAALLGLFARLEERRAQTKASGSSDFLREI